MPRIFKTNDSILQKLIRRETSGKLVIPRVQVMKNTNTPCPKCGFDIKAVILDLHKDLDTFGFRYHYYVTKWRCYNCTCNLFD